MDIFGPIGWRLDGFTSSDSDESPDPDPDQPLSFHVEEKAPTLLFPADGSEGEDTDDAMDDYVKDQYLRFREAYVGSKHQRKQLTFDRYLDLVHVAQTATPPLLSQSRLLPVLTKEHFTAFRAAGTILHPSIVNGSRCLTTATSEPRPLDAAVLATARPAEKPKTVTVETISFSPPHASVQVSSVPSPSQTHSRLWHRRRRAALKAQSRAQGL